MLVKGARSHSFEVTWDPTEEQTRKCYADLSFATEFGAYGVAVLVIERLTDLTVVERSRKGTGFDFWLGPKSSSAPLFQEKGRLEVSGILGGSDHQIGSRLHEKVQQMLAGGIPRAETLE